MKNFTQQGTKKLAHLLPDHIKEKRHAQNHPRLPDHTEISPDVLSRLFPLAYPTSWKDLHT